MPSTIVHHLSYVDQKLAERLLHFLKRSKHCNEYTQVEECCRVEKCIEQNNYLDVIFPNKKSPIILELGLLFVSLSSIYLSICLSQAALACGYLCRYLGSTTVVYLPTFGAQKC